MPFTGSSGKKPDRPPGPPDYRQITILDSIDRATLSLTQIITQASGNSPDIKPIVKNINEAAANAKRWVLAN